MLFVKPLHGLKRYAIMCACLPALIVFWLPRALAGQELLHTFNDNLPKRHSTVTSVIADDDHFYYAGRSSAQCGPRHFVGCVDADGIEVWSTLDQEIKLGRVDQLRVLEGSLFVGVTFDAASYSATPDRAGLYKVDPASGEIEWFQIVGNEGDTGSAAQILAYNEEMLIFYSRSSDLQINRLRFIDVANGEILRSADLTDASYNTGVNIAADSQGAVYFNFTDGLVKLDGASTDLSETLWEFRTPDLQTVGVIEDMFITASGRLYCLTSLGEALELDTETGELINQFDFTNLDEVVYVADKDFDGHNLYCTWQTAARSGDSLNVSKLDLESGRLEWRTRVGFAAQGVMSRSLVLGDDNTLLLNGDLFNEEPVPQSIGISRLDVVNGAIDTQYTIESDNGLILSTLSRSGDAIRLFNNVIEEAPFSVFTHIESRRLNAAGIPEGDSRMYAGRAAFPSAVLQMINAGEQVIQLRQVGSSVAVVWLDKELNIEYGTLLPQSNNIATGARMAVNSLGQVAVTAGLQWWQEPSEERAAPGYKIGPLPDRYNIHLLSAGGEILRSFFGQGEIGGYWLRDIVSDGVNFYTARINGQGQHSENNVQILRINPEGIETRALSVVKLGSLSNSRNFIAHENRVLFAGAVQDQRGRVWEINTADFSIDPLLDWPDCEEVATIAVNGSRTTLACRFQGRAEIVHIDLESADILWRQRLDQDDQVLYLFAHNQKVYTLGNKLNLDSDCLDFSIGRIDVNSGEFDWIKLRPCDGGPSPQVFFADMKEDEIAVGGRLHHNPIDGRAHFFVMRLDPEGRERDFYVIDYPESVPAPIGEFDPGPVFYAPDGSLLYTIQQRFDDDCYRSAAVYRLDPVTAVAGEQQESFNRLAIFPNPAEGAARLVFDGLAGTVYTVEVQDLLGRVMLNRRVVLEHPSSGIPLDLTHFSRGTYTVRINGAGRSRQAVLNKQ